MSGLIHKALVIERLAAPDNGEHGATPAARLLVELDTASACQRCANGEGCGAGLFAGRSRPVRLVVDDRLGASAGQRVWIEGHSGSRWLQVVAGAYGLPTLGLLSGAIVPRLLGLEAEWVAVIGAALGLCFTIILWQRVIEPRLRAPSAACSVDVIETAHTVSIEQPEVS